MTILNAVMPPVRKKARLGTGHFIMAVLILFFGFYIIYPIILIFIESFNIAGVIVGTYEFGVEHWRQAFSEPETFESLRNTMVVFAAYTTISFPLAVLISWILARTPIRYSRGLEFMFWVSFMLPGLTTTIGWSLLLDPFFGFFNVWLKELPFISGPVFNIYSVEGIVFAHLMGNAMSQKVMLLTPAFRNMNATLEEAGRVSGAGKIRTMMRVTLPVMVPPMVVVFLLNLVRMFNTFEIEQILGTPIGFFVYSTQIYDYVREMEPAEYGPATALASLTLVIIFMIIPLQRWLLTRRQYTTVSGDYKPGLVHLGALQPFAFVFVVTIVALLTIVPVLTLLGGSFMTRAGFFQAIPTYTLDHWQIVLADPIFFRALKTTVILAITTAIISPLLFSLVAYILVRRSWPGKLVLDSIFWGSAGIPGILSGLGLLWVISATPGLNWLYGTIWILIIVVILQGKLTSIQMFKSVFLQMGDDMEEAARIAGAGWWYTYFKIWLPLIAPTLVLMGVLNFVIAAGSTGSVILLASRETVTLSLLALEYMTTSTGSAREVAGIISLFIVAMTAGLALIARWVGFQAGVKNS
ncbi:MAG: ABC transporter permease subunit [Alphaproteobacteria bacterium]|nr:ABC transporter permease subunit [Alphaproteobacteria bacterium]